MRRQSHRRRTGKTRGFCLHYRHPGVQQRKMDRWISEYHKEISSVLSKGSRGQLFNIQMGTKAIARGDYIPDRACDLKGVAAYDREKFKGMKDLGLATKDDLITQRMREYLSAIGNDRLKTELLRNYGMRIKLQCPQTVWRFFRPGHRQNGYAHYRIRPLVMFLYAIKRGNDTGVDVNTDDIALSAFLYFTPMQQPLVNEDYLTNYINDYFDTFVSN